MWYFSADFHLFHRAIVLYSKRTRFMTEADRLLVDHPNPKEAGKLISDQAVNAMNQTIVDRVNQVVGEEDHFCFTGDFLFRGGANAWVEQWSRFRCRHIYVVAGNHDPHSSLHNIAARLPKGKLTILPQIAVRRIEDTVVVLSHYPMVSWPQKGYGAISLFGHVHGNWPRNIPQHPRQIDVGVDCHDFYPVSLTRVLEIVHEREKRNPAPHATEGHIG
jgi:calcineurin-like phosphoesterase family protein